MEDKRVQQAEEILAWLGKEMKYSASALPSLQDLKRLCRGNTVPIWSHLLSHVRSIKNVETIEGNLRLDELRQAGADERAKKASELKLLQAKRDQLRAQVKEIRAGVEKVTFDVEQLQADLCEADTLKRFAQEELKEKERKLVMLDEMEAKVSQTIALLAEYKRRLVAANAKFTDRQVRSNKESLTVKEIFGTDGPAATLESDTTKLVREVCQSIQEALEAGLQGPSGPGPRRPPIDQNKLSLLAENITDRPAVLVQALTDLAERQAAVLVKEVESLSPGSNSTDGSSGVSQSMGEMVAAIKKQLREEVLSHNATWALWSAQYQSSALKFGPSTPSESSEQPMTVDQLLQVQREEHFAKVLAAEQAKNESYKLEIQLKQLQIGPADENSRNSSNTSTPKARSKSVLEELQSLEADLAGEAAGAAFISQLLVQLNEYRALLEKDAAELKTKSARIEDLDRMRKEKMQLIDQLMKQTLHTRTTFEGKMRELSAFATQKLGGGKVQALTAATAELRDAVNKEARAFIQAGTPPGVSQAPVVGSNGLVTPVRSGPVPAIESPGKTATTLDLPQHWPTELEFVVNTLKLPRHLSSDAILEAIVRSLREVEGLEKQLVENQSKMMQLEGEGVSERALAVVGQEMKQLAHLTSHQWIPVLTATTEQTTKAIAHCESVKTQINEWWEQPAQHTAPWVVVDGKTLKDFQTQWIDQTHKLIPT